MARRVVLGVRAKEAVGLTLLAIVVVATTTVIHMSQLSRVVVEEAARNADLVGKQIYAHLRVSLARSACVDPREALRRDRGLRELIDASVGSAPHLVHVAVVDTTGQAIVHSEPTREGTAVPIRPGLAELAALGPLGRVQALYAGGGVYEAVLPLQLDGQPLGSVRLDVSTVLMRRELRAALERSVALAALALPFAWLLALGLSRVILRPVRALTEHVGRLRRGELDVTAPLAQGDEVGQLAAQIQRLGEQMHADRLAQTTEAARLQQVMDHLEDGIIFLNDAGQPVFYNRAAEAIVAVPLEEAARAPLVEQWAPAHPLRSLLGRAFTDRTGFHNTAVTVPVDGRSRELLVSLVFFSDDRKSLGSMVLLRDFDSIRTLESLISYSAKLAALGRLTSGVAHEIKNPLNAMTIYLELLRERLGSSSEEVREGLAIIKREIGRLDRLVQGFLRFVRPQELDLKPLDLNGLFQQVTVLLEGEWRSRNVRFELEFAPDLPAVMGDHELLRQAFLNVVLNACQAMPEGGTVRIATMVNTGVNTDNVVVVRIADEGVGIPEKDLDRIFNLYFTTKPDGNGVGLSMVYRIVQLHDGRIDVASSVGRGTTFTIRFPAAPPTA
jgi:signal transduction histidine kinase